MAKADSTLLDINDPFPKMNFQLLSGETISLPEEFGDNYGIILFYRGNW